MLIDWLTVVAQIVNFLILVGLMRRFLYGPLLHAIDAREAHVAGQLAEADRKSQDADRKAAEVETRLAGIESRGAQLIEDARKQAEQQKAELVETARHAVDEMEAKWREDVRREQTVFFGEIRRSAAGEVLSVARRALGDLAGADLDRCAVETLLKKLNSLDAADLRQLSTGEITVASATCLPADLQTRLGDAIGRRIGEPVKLRFECAPELEWGLELRGAGRKISWTPGSYVDSIEEKLRSVVDAHD